jgi:hypothetical protein
LRNVIAVAEEGRGRDVRYRGEIDTTEAATRELVTDQIPSTDVLLRGGANGIRALSADPEACPRLHRSGTLAHPEETWRSGEEEPTRCVGLAKLLRAEELTAVWVPDERHEAMRDLSRAREAARTVLAEIGDLSRFQNPRELTGYLGLIRYEAPQETRSTAAASPRPAMVGRGASWSKPLWSYRHAPRVSREKQIKVAAAPRAVREIAWKAKMRFCGRFRSLTRKGTRPTIVATAIARELSAFIWAINREVMVSRFRLSPRLQPRPESHRATIGQAQGPAAQNRRIHSQEPRIHRRTPLQDRHLVSRSNLPG